MTDYYTPNIIGAGGHARVVCSEVVFAGGEKCGVVAIGNPVYRKREVEAHGDWTWTRAISPCARIHCPFSDIGEGSQILDGAVVAVGAKVGKHVIVNHNAVVDHDCEVGDYVHVAPCASLSGGVKVGEGSWIGTGARVVSGEVPPWTMVRANSVFPHDYNAGRYKLRPVEDGLKRIKA